MSLLTLFFMLIALASYSLAMYLLGFIMGKLLSEKQPLVVAPPQVTSDTFGKNSGKIENPLGADVFDNVNATNFEISRLNKASQSKVMKYPTPEEVRTRKEKEIEKEFYEYREKNKPDKGSFAV